MKNSASFRFCFKLVLRYHVVQKLLDLLVWLTQRTLTERLLLRRYEKRFVYLRHLILVLALTWVLFISLNENVILLIFIKNWFLLLYSIENSVFNLSEASNSILKRTFAHRCRIMEAHSVNSLFRSEWFA